MKKLWLYIPYIILVFVVLFFAIFGFIYHGESYRITIDPPKTMNTGWFYGTTEISQLPEDLNIDKNTPFTINHTLSDDFATRNVILVRSSLSNIAVHLDGVLIYEKNFGETAFPPYASLWHFIEIPGHSEGSELSLTFSSPYPSMSGIINEIHYGSYAEIYNYLFQTFGIRLYIGIFVLFSGLLIMALSLVLFRNYNKGFMYIGLFTVFLSLWMLAESRMLQWFVGNTFILGSLAYVMLPLFPIPMLVYIKNHVMKVHKKFTQILILVFSTTLILVLFMHTTRIADFFETVILSQIMLIIGIVTVLYYSFIEYKKYDNKNAARVFRIIAFLMIFVFIEFLLFIFDDFVNTSVGLLIGILLLSIILLYNFGKYLIFRFKMGYQKEIYEKLAYKDQLTGARNRLGYEEDFESWFNDEQKRDQIRLIYFDFDDLKFINDTKGHLEGDVVLKEGYQVIQNVFGDQGVCYRLGGDEFACLYLGKTDEILKEKTLQFENEISKLNKKLGHQFRVSIGSTVYQNTDVKPSDMSKRADDNMYFNKCEHKGNCERIRPDHLK